MAFQLLNFLSLTLATAMSTGDVVLIVQDDDLPKAEAYNPAFTLALTLVGEDSDQHEIVWVTGRVGTSLTVIRAQEGTFSRIWQPGTQVVAAFTKAVIQSVLGQTPDASGVAYTADGFLNGANVQAALGDAGTQIALLASDAVSPLPPIARVFAPSNVVTADSPLFGLNSARIVTNGLAAPATTFPTPVNLQERPFAVMLHARCYNIPDHVRTRLYVSLSDGLYSWDIQSSAYNADAEWSSIFLSSSSVTVAAAEAIENQGKIRIEVLDDGTGFVIVDVAAVEFYSPQRGQIDLFLKPTSIAEGDSAVLLGSLGYPVHLILDEAEIGTTFPQQTLERWRNSGARFVIAAAAITRLQTIPQITAGFFRCVRKMAAANIEPWGFYYTDDFYGSIAATPNVRMQEIVMKFFPRGYIAKLPNDNRGNGEAFPPVINLRKATGDPGAILGTTPSTAFSVALFLQDEAAKTWMYGISDAARRSYVGVDKNLLLTVADNAANLYLNERQIAQVIAYAGVE